MTFMEFFTGAFLVTGTIYFTVMIIKSIR